MKIKPKVPEPRILKEGDVKSSYGKLYKKETFYTKWMRILGGLFR
jgi:hypothetical protein